ncbi:LLM class flavin-dependent oxidoreductase [Nocardia jiangxiensis]|uniref:LLM class flavin-dependent oxidoreductase n=1 Tax=Nocardia jiangxiensis TaxID=282685 RepID=UPI000594C18D|nr:LLM class flavin-dependent oxidoreductase [Nocardia jiangxiensis]
MSKSHYPTSFGVFMAPFHKIGVSPSVLFERDLQVIELADKLGFQEAWLGEHHSGGHEPIGSPEMMLAAASQRTGNIRLGTAVNSLPYHNPFLLAERLVMLDHLSHGRAMMGFGPGQLLSDAHMLGIDPGRQRDMMLEGAEVIVRLLRGETVTAKSDWFDLHDAKLQVLPYSVPELDVVVAAVTSPSGPLTSGRLGVGMINLSSTNPAAFDALRSHWKIAENEATKAGRTISRKNWRLSAISHIAETEEQARNDCKYGFEEIWNYLAHISPLPASDKPNVEDMIDEAIAGGSVLIGTPDTAIETIHRLADQTGGFGSFIMTLTDFTTYDRQLNAVKLWAEYVIPEFRGQLKPIREHNKWVLDGEWKAETMAAINAATAKYEAQQQAEASS